MSELTRKQANLIKRQIKRLYRRNYIPVITLDNTLTIGDILASKYDISPIIDSSVFSSNNIGFLEGAKTNKNITSSSEINISTKLKGEAMLSEYFKVDEAGIAVEFSSENQMFLKVQGLRQQSVKNFIEFRKELLMKYTKGEISSNVYVVRGLVCADKYYLQYSGNKGGNIGFTVDGEIQNVDIEVDSNFSIKWKKEVGYNIDGSKGGVLAYRVSGVRLKRHLIPSTIHEKIINGMPEADVLELMSFTDREKLINDDALEVIDLTDEILLAQDEYLA